MKYRKYILLLLLVIFIGLSRVEADTCYYIGENFKARMDSGNKNVTINSYFGKVDAKVASIDNWNRIGAIRLIDSNVNVISSYSEKKCPRYLILTSISNAISTRDVVFGTDNNDEVDSTKNQLTSYHYKTVSGTYLHGDGTPITEEEYNGGDIELPSIPGSSNCQTQYDICIKILSPDRCLSDYNKCIEEQCGDIFGNKNDEESLAYLINKVLMYVRIIVPILIIVLGMIDLAKAVIASKEEEMRKAQKTFVKRLIIGIVVFFIPVLVNLIMSFADMIWENYGSCGIDNIIK